MIREHQPSVEPAGPPAGPGADDAIAVLRELLWLRRLVAQYPAGHPAIGERVAALHELMLHRFARPPGLALDILDELLLLNGILVEPDRSAAQVLRDFAEHGIQGIRIRENVRPDELLTAAEILSEHASRPDGEPVEARLARGDVQNISLTRIVPLDTRWDGRQWPDAPQGPIDPDYDQALRLAMGTFEDATSNRQLDQNAIRDLVQLLVRRVARSDAALGQILAVKEYENLTYAHSVNVAVLSLLIGRRIGLDEATIGALVEAALLHDIGKTRIPLEILRKPGALTDHERRQIELHATYGAEILVHVEGLGPLTATVALEHHRTFRGGGYPDLGEGVIPHAMSQIVSVADTYEAVTGARSYKDPTPPERACLILARAAGTQLHPALVKAFVNTISFFPIGSFVRTSRDELAVAVRTNADDPLHPVVAVFDARTAAVGDLIDTRARDAAGNYLRHIVETVPPPEGAPDLTMILAMAPDGDAAAPAGAV